MQRIVLTGGPCAGKTTTLEALKEIFLNEAIVFIPETAGIILSSGIALPPNMSIDKQWQLQKAIIFLQSSMEEAFAFFSSGILLALCERGILDGAAYVPGGVEIFCQRFDLDKSLVFDRYLAVIHLESVATGAPNVYSNIKNPFRYETLEEAQRREYAIREVWKEHPNYKFVSCKKGIEGKITYVKDFISKLLINMAG